jgi:hypothetical protein
MERKDPIGDIDHNELDQEPIDWSIWFGDHD